MRINCIDDHSIVTSCFVKSNNISSKSIPVERSDPSHKSKDTTHIETCVGKELLSVEQSKEKEMYYPSYIEDKIIVERHSYTSS